MWFFRSIQADCDGFTLAEFSITIVVTSILILSAASLLISSNEQLILAENETRAIRDHTLIAKLFANTIRQGDSRISKIYSDSTKTTPASSGTCLVITSPDSSTTTFYKGSNDFVLVQPGGSKSRIVRKVINNLTISDSYTADSLRTVQISVTTNHNGKLLSTHHTYSFRN
jgi:prepilin-type N-terminal cleavage/methylation domain-containing protein